jgi:hypothetical protein
MYFVDSTTFAVTAKLFLLVVTVFWLALAFWVYRDARRRLDDPWLVGTAALLGLLVPFLGPIVYTLFRPPEVLDEVRLRNAEIRALELRLGEDTAHCPVCRAGVKPEFLVCPVCTTRLKQACATCSAPLEPLWQACPYCATPMRSRAVELDLDAALSAEAATLGANATRDTKATLGTKPSRRSGAARR